MMGWPESTEAPRDTWKTMIEALTWDAVRMRYFISELKYCPSVGECIISHTNYHTIGSEPKLKEGAETEVARLQFQMGK